MNLLIDRIDQTCKAYEALPLEIRVPVAVLLWTVFFRLIRFMGAF